MQQRPDLTLLSTTFPERCKPEVTRDNLISFIKDQFSSEQKVIAVQGVVGSGKTTLLAQFARTYPDRCFSFFSGTTLPTSNPRIFLMDMCEQMATVLGKATNNLDQYDTDKLEVLYLDLFRQIGRHSKVANANYYFVIDGIEWIAASRSGHSILEYLPGEPKGNVRLLLSSEVGKHLSFSIHPFKIVFFSRKETEFYLGGLNLQQEDIQAIHDTCQGMPGYLAGLRRLILSGLSFSEIQERLPHELEEVFQLEWTRMGRIEAPFEKFLALLAYSSEPVTLHLAHKILALPQSVTPAHEERVRKTSFLRFEQKGGVVSFVSDAYKQFVANHLNHLREDIEQKLIQHYSEAPFSKQAITLLPQYLATHGNYAQLRSLVTTDYISRALRETHDGAALKKTLAIAADQAITNGDLEALFRYSLASSILTSLSRKPTAISEVQALLALGDYGAAFVVAYDSLLLEDRLQLAALIGSRMQQSGLSVPEDALLDLEQTANAVDAPALGRRAIEIAASLFDLLPEAAVRLVERAGIAGNSERSLDIARAMLAMSLEKDSEDMVTARITDQSIKDFASAHSPRIRALSADEIMAEAHKSANTSTKIMMLVSWCNEHNEDGAAWKVVEQALETITGDQSYAPSMRTLRQITQSVKPEPSKEVEQIIKRVDLLKVTALATPLEESIWLELVLAHLEAAHDPEQGKNRMLSAFFNIESLGDLDAQCYALLRVILMAPLIDPQDKLQLCSEAEQALKAQFKLLLDTSADHESIAVRFLQSLAKRRPKLAYSLAHGLNTSRRRDIAFQKILDSYVRSAGAQADLKLIEEITGAISSKGIRQYSRIRAIDVLSETELFVKASHARSFLRDNDEIDHPWNKCYRLAFSINAMEKSGDKGFVTSQFKDILTEVERIDTKWEQVELGFSLASTLGKTAPHLAKELFASSCVKRSGSPLSEEFFADIYMDCLSLAIKLVLSPAFQASFIWPRCEQIISLIRNIPSFSSQCEMLAKLALKLHLSERQKEFRQVIESALLPSLGNCLNESARNTALTMAGPALYEYEGNHFFDRLTGLHPSSKDRTLFSILRYVLSNCPPDEPVDLSKLSADVDVLKAKKVCEIIQCMTIDSEIFTAIQIFVDAVVFKDSYDQHRERCRGLVERSVLEIADRLEQIAESKLPDVNNIKHRGYLVVCKAYIARLRAAAQRRAPERQDWTALIAEADAIPNLADKILVYTYLARQMSVVQSSLGEVILKKAEGMILDIRNPIDRFDRQYSVAQTWKEFGRPEAVKDLIRNSVKALRSSPLTKKRDEVIGQMLELAHSVDPDFASSLTSMVENPIAEHKLLLEYGAKRLQKAPATLSEEGKFNAEDTQRMLGNAASNMSAEYHAGAGILPHRSVVTKWLHQMVNSNFEDAEKVAAWALDYTLKQSNTPAEVEQIYQALIDLLTLCIDVGSPPSRTKTKSPSVSLISLPTNLKLFSAGSKNEALVALEDWIVANINSYMKIYDPYFTADNLSILKSVPTDVQVYVITSWKAQSGVSVGDRVIEKLFKDAWSRMSDSNPPWTQIVIVGTRSGDSPIHNRYILTDGKGLTLGTSIGGLGNKDSDLRVLDKSETDLITSKFVDPLLGPQLYPYKTERLVVHSFVL